DEWIANQIFWRGWQAFEPEQAPLFFRFAERASVTIDVGAHVGFYSVSAGLANPESHVYSFEPLPRVFQRLQRNVQINHVHNVEPILAAVGSTDGVADFFSTDAD